MKQGWIQVNNNGTKEPLAPKTMADMVYVDEMKSQTVEDALAATVPIDRGGTGATSAENARANLELESGAVRRILYGVANVSINDPNETAVEEIAFSPPFPSAPACFASVVTERPHQRFATAVPDSPSALRIFARAEVKMELGVFWLAVL